jgi:hypothetical protein
MESKETARNTDRSQKVVDAADLETPFSSALRACGLRHDHDRWRGGRDANAFESARLELVSRNGELDALMEALPDAGELQEAAMASGTGNCVDLDLFEDLPDARTSGIDLFEDPPNLDEGLDQIKDDKTRAATLVLRRLTK